MGRLVSVCAFAVLLSASGLSARTWYITPDGTGDAPTIQAGIDSAAATDTVLLAHGTFTDDGNRDIEYHGKAITVTSENGDPDVCVIDCEGNALDKHNGFRFTSGEGPLSVLQGVTITGGYKNSGGAIEITNASSPTFRDCVFLANNATRGGGVHVDGYPCRPTFENCLFSGNYASQGGGMNEQWGAEPVLVDCTFHNNGGVEGGALKAYGDRPELIGCTFSRNQGYEGGALHLERCGSGTVITGCTFLRNWGDWGGAIGLWLTSPGITSCSLVFNGSHHGAGIYQMGEAAQVSNCIVAYSAAGSAIACSHVDELPPMMCCDIFGNEGGDWVGCIADQSGINGNFSACPSFCNAEDGDFTLCDESPCLPGNHPHGYDCGLVGAWGQGCICGPSATETSTWGEIKSIYR